MAVLDRLFARFYDTLVEPMEVRGLADARRALLAPLSGTVCEVGAGTGLNLPHYPDAVERVVACEPSPGMAEHLRRRAADDPRVEVVEAPGEALPLADASVDHAVATLVLCTVEDLDRTIGELARVVRPAGTLALIEHVAAEPGWIATTQRIVEPAWKVGARGCHLTRDPLPLLERHGFDTAGIEPWTVPGSIAIADRARRGHAVRR